MNPTEVLRIVDAIHRDKNIDKEIVFQAIEAALVSAAKKYYGEEAEIEVTIHREEGSISGSYNGSELDPEETVGRIGAQTAKQVIIQKIREAERDALFVEYEEMIGQMAGGVVQRNEGGAATVALGNVEAILPRSEQIPGESHHPGERVRATIFDVRKQGSRVKVLLSRTRRQLIERLFEQEIPEIADGVIAVKAISREPGYRSKVAVSSTDQRVDCVGACVGVRGNRIKNIVDELSGERIDIVRYHEDPQTLIPNALQPAEIEEVILCQMMGRAIVMVREDQLSLAIGRRGQNVRLASKLCVWDIEIMTREELEEQIERAVTGFSELEGVSDELAEMLVGEGFLSYDDLSVIEPDALMEMGDLSAEQVENITNTAEEKAEEAEQAAASERRRQKQLEREQAAAEAAEAEAAAQAGAEEADAGDGEESPPGEQPVEEPVVAEGASEEPALAEATEPSQGVSDETPSAEEAVDVEDLAEEPLAEEQTVSSPPDETVEEVVTPAEDVVTPEEEVVTPEEEVGLSEEEQPVMEEVVTPEEEDTAAEKE